MIKRFRQAHDRQGNRMETILSKHWHHLPETEVLDLLETDLDRELDLFAVENRCFRTEGTGHSGSSVSRPGQPFAEQLPVINLVDVRSRRLQ